MKISMLIAMMAAALLTATTLQAQTSFTNNGPSSKARANKAAVKLRPRTDGSVARAIRSGKPLQMVNPAAPAEYGDGRDMARRNPDDPYQRPQGLKLFVLEY